MYNLLSNSHEPEHDYYEKKIIPKKKKPCFKKK